MHSAARPTLDHLFVYGSLVDPERVCDVLGHPHTGERLAAQLAGFRRVETGAYPYPYLVASASASVSGVLIMDLSPSDLLVLDAYEDVGADVYRRQRVNVQAWGCGARPVTFEAWAYVGGPALLGLA